METVPGKEPIVLQGDSSGKNAYQSGIGVPRLWFARGLEARGLEIRGFLSADVLIWLRHDQGIVACPHFLGVESLR